MISRGDVQVGGRYRYPHPSGFGHCETFVREVTRPTEAYPQGRVRHEAIYAGWGAVDTMEVFMQNAERLTD